MPQRLARRSRARLCEDQNYTWSEVHAFLSVFGTPRNLVLVPALRPGDIVIMDNLGSNKSSAVRQAIRATGARLLFLPKCSPGLNPIEQLFAKLKHGLRKAAKRTFDTVSDTIAEGLDTVTSTECSNYLVNAEYAQS